MKSIEVTYLTIERCGSGLFETQVINPLIEIAKTDTEITLRLLVVNYFWLLLHQKSYLKELRQRLDEAGIRLNLIPFLLPVKFSLKYQWYCRILVYAITLTLCLIPRGKIIHCRGYFAAIAALNSRRFEHVVFDMRSLWVAENIAAGNLVEDSLITRYWTELEFQAIAKSSIVIGVSDPMGVYVKRLVSSACYETVPIAVDVARLGYRATSSRAVRSQLGLSLLKPVAVYSGSFGLSGINVDALVNLIAKLTNLTPELQVLILSSEPRSVVESLANRVGLSPSRYRHVTASPSELGTFLSAADFGFHALPYQPDSDTRLGTKIVEYWANGLPVVVSSTVGAAAKICEEQSIGVVVDLDDPAALTSKELPTRETHKKQLARFDMRDFDISGVAHRYVGLYRSV